MTLCALVSALTATARTTISPNLVLDGSLTLAWNGDPALGCAAQGLCGVRGSLEMISEPFGGSGLQLPSVELLDSYSAARVITLSASGSTAATCSDSVPVDFFLRVRRSRAVIDHGASLQLPSAGRCAGPTVEDLLALALPARKLGAHGYDLSGRTTFPAGPFTVTAISTLRVVQRGVSLIATGGGAFVVPGGGHSPTGKGTILEEHAEAVYRIDGISGALTTTFSGLAAPLCDPLGACSTTGVLDESFSPRGTLTFSGSRPVKRRVGARAALADLRAGRLGVNVNATALAATLSEVLVSAGGQTCADRTSQTTSLIDFPGPNGGLTLSPGAPRQDPSAFDPLRTRCPGPSGTDVLGIAQLAAPLATGTISMGGVGDPLLGLTLGTHGSFLASDYAGVRGGSVVMSLVALHTSGGTSRIRP